MSQQVLNQFRSDKKLRDDCVAIYEALGMDLNTAFRMFMERTRMVGGLPFPATLIDYNRETMDAMRETMDIEAGRIPAKRYQSVDELFADNDAEITGGE